MIKKIGVLTSGGDAPGMNACLRAVVRAGLKAGLEMYAIHDGYKGIIDRNIEKLDRHSVSDILNRGGTVIGTARLPQFAQPEVQMKAVEILQSYGIDALVTIGGDGTYQGALALSRRGINCIGLPGTIDNDIASTDYTIGFDTALNCIIECVDRLRDTSTSHQRCSVIEVMGRNCPDLAAYAGVACGAEITITQESEWTKESVIAELKKQKESGKRHAIVIVAEHICDVHEFAHEIERDSGFETKAEVLGHMQRGGSPTAFDRVLASRMGDYAVDLLINGVSGACVGLVKNELKYYPIEEALKLPRHSCKDLLKVGARLE